MTHVSNLLRLVIAPKGGNDRAKKGQRQTETDRRRENTEMGKREESTGG